MSSRRVGGWAAVGLMILPSVMYIASSLGPAGTQQKVRSSQSNTHPPLQCVWPSILSARLPGVCLYVCACLSGYLSGRTQECLRPSLPHAVPLGLCPPIFPTRRMPACCVVLLTTSTCASGGADRAGGRAAGATVPGPEPK